MVYCLRHIDFLSGSHGLAELISVGVTVVLHLWKKNILLTVGLGTLCYMFLVQAVFV
ncbi:MAG: branched-chain amino acid transporter permease [Kineothrix sp.]